MRAREFVNEATKRDIPDEHINSLPNTHKFPAMDGSGYNLYRFGMSMASSPDNEHIAHKDGAVGETPMIVAYSKGDEEIVKHSKGVHGMGSVKVTGPSKEQTDTNKTSPVAKPKRNRYGV